MGIPLKQLQQMIDAPTFALYMAYHTIDPFTEDRADFRNAMNTSFLVNAFCGAKTKLDDFMPKFGQPQGQSPEQMLQMAKFITTKHTAKKAGK